MPNSICEPYSTDFVELRARHSILYCVQVLIVPKPQIEYQGLKYGSIGYRRISCSEVAFLEPRWVFVASGMIHTLWGKI